MKNKSNQKPLLKIYFEDHWQDLLWIVIDKNGLIIDCNLQKQVWCGFSVLLSKLEIGENIWFDISSKTGLVGDVNRYDFVVEKIEELKAKEYSVI